MDFKQAIAILNNVVNTPDVEEFKKYIYELQNENLELKAQLKECLAEVHVAQEWTNTKALYKEFETLNKSVVYVKTEESSPKIFYCPVCFGKKTIVPLQSVPNHGQGFGAGGKRLIDPDSYRICQSCEKIYHI